jgi:hypothetical protein
MNDKLLHITDWMPMLLTLGENLGTKDSRHLRIMNNKLLHITDWMLTLLTLGE